jgi:alkylation response protein AidB-like acyl-CoA dehydrogenase
MGLPFEALMVVAMEAGRAVLPAPLTTTLLAARALAAAEGWDALLTEMAAGTTSATIALKGTPGAHNDDDTLGCRAVRQGDGWRLDGTLRSVAYGPLADIVLVEAADPNGAPGLFVVPTGASGLSWTALSVMDRTVPRYDFVATVAVLPAGAALYPGGGGAAATRELEEEWTAVLAAESLGACERMVEIAAEYAKFRVQFGRPIGTNQAVKVRIAEMATAVERMRVAVYYAAVRIDERAADRTLACSMAKGMASGLGAYVGTQAIHVHGGIGYTWEHDIHFWVKRAKSNELLLGDTPLHMSRVADLVLGPVA